MPGQTTGADAARCAHARWATHNRICALLVKKKEIRWTPSRFTTFRFAASLASSPITPPRSSSCTRAHTYHPTPRTRSSPYPSPHHSPLPARPYALPSHPLVSLPAPLLFTFLPVALCPLPHNTPLPFPSHPFLFLVIHPLSCFLYVKTVLLGRKCLCLLLLYTCYHRLE